MQIKTVSTICVLIIGSVMASQSEPASGIIEKPREEVPQEQPSGPQGSIASQEGKPASGVSRAKPRRKVPRKRPSGPQKPIASQKDEPSGVIIVKSKLPKQELPSSALEGPDGNVLLRNVEEIASLENNIKEVGENEGILKAIQAAKKNLRKNVFNKDIGTDKNIFEAIMAAKNKSLGFLFEIASPKVLGDLAKQEERPKVKEWAEEAMKVYEKLKLYTFVQGIFLSASDYDAFIELIGGITTFGVELPRAKFLTDGVYASVLGSEELSDVRFELLLNLATPAAIRLALNSKWLAHRFALQNRYLAQKAKLRHLSLEEAYRQRAESSIARQLGIAPEKGGHYSVPELSEHIASFLQHQPIENDIITEPSGRIDPSILEPFRVHLKESIPEEIIELAVGKEQAEGFKLNEEQVKQVRPYGPALVTHIFENKLDIEQFLDRTGLYADYETFVVFMEVYGKDTCLGGNWNIHRNNFLRLKKALGGRYIVRAFFSVRTFHAALSLYDAIPWEKPFTEDRLRFLAKVTRFPLDAFLKVVPMGVDDGLFERRALAILARRVKNIREAAEKGDLKYLREHLLDGNVTEYGLRSILEHGSTIPMEAFKLILSVISHRLSNFAHMTPIQRTLVEGHKALYDQLMRACALGDLESIGTLLANPNCTPGMRVSMFLDHSEHDVLVEGLYPDHCELILAKWMNRRAWRSAELDVVINRCLQHYAAKHEQVKSS